MRMTAHSRKDWVLPATMERVRRKLAGVTESEG
jgi:hypothetical protein